MAYVFKLPFKRSVNADLFVHVDNPNPVNEELFGLKFRPPFLSVRKRAIRGVNSFIFVDAVAPSTQTWTDITQNSASWSNQSQNSAAWSSQAQNSSIWTNESLVPLT